MLKKQIAELKKNAVDLEEDSVSPHPRGDDDHAGGHTRTTCNYCKANWTFKECRKLSKSEFRAAAWNMFENGDDIEWDGNATSGRLDWQATVHKRIVKLFDMDKYFSCFSSAREKPGLVPEGGSREPRTVNCTYLGIACGRTDEGHVRPGGSR